MNNTTTIKELVSLATICNIPTTTLAKAAGLSAQNFNNKLKGLSMFTIIHSEAIEAKLLEVREALNAHFNINRNQDVYDDKQTNIYDDKQTVYDDKQTNVYDDKQTVYDDKQTNVYDDKQNNVYDDKQPAAAPIGNDGYVPANTIYAEFEAAREADPNSFREDSNGRTDISNLFKHKKAAPPTTEEAPIEEASQIEEIILTAHENKLIEKGGFTLAQVLENRKELAEFAKNKRIQDNEEEQLPF